MLDTNSDSSRIFINIDDKAILLNIKIESFGNAIANYDENKCLDLDFIYLVMKNIDRELINYQRSVIYKTIPLQKENESPSEFDIFFRKQNEMIYFMTLIMSVMDKELFLKNFNSLISLKNNTLNEFIHRKKIALEIEEIG